MVGRKKRPGEDRPGWGGKRPGSGPKPKEERLRKIAVTLSAQDVERLRVLGEGNVSAGVRRLLRMLLPEGTPLPPEAD